MLLRQGEIMPPWGVPRMFEALALFDVSRLEHLLNQLQHSAIGYFFPTRAMSFS